MTGGDDNAIQVALSSGSGTGTRRRRSKQDSREDDDEQQRYQHVDGDDALENDIDQMPQNDPASRGQSAADCGGADAAATSASAAPQHQEEPPVVPFLTRAQIRELSVKIKNMEGDERSSRAIIKRLADSGVGVRITESLQGVEVYVDALTEEVKASRDSDERERECFLYRDGEGRLFNLVIAVSGEIE